MIRSLLDAVLVDIGGTLVREADPSTPVTELAVEVLPHVVEDLVALAAVVPVAAVTNTSVMTEDDLRRLLGPVGLSSPLQAIVTSAEVGHEKPHPATVLAALERLGLEDPTRVLFIGDRASDEGAAAAAGVHYAGIDRAGLGATVRSWFEARAGARFATARAGVTPPDGAAALAAADLQDRLTKPRGALGRLESLGTQLAGLAGVCPPPPPVPAAIAIFAGDHGVLAEGVSPWPQEVTAQMVGSFCTGGAAINVLARQHDARVVVVDVGVAAALDPDPALLQRNVARGTANLALGPAMTVTEARLALDVGAEVAARLATAGAGCLVTGDMGIGNTTPSASLIAAVTGREASTVTGRGTGIDDATLGRKVAVVAAAVARTDGLDAEAVLVEVGGLEIAAIAGLIVGGAAARLPVVLDGVIALAGAVVADALVPGVRAWCVAGHRSVEPGAAAALDHLRLEPLLDLGLRLGEGSGAALALPLLESAARILSEMATFDAAGVTDKGAAGVTGTGAAGAAG